MIFVGIVRYLAREVGRGRRSSYVVRSKVDCLADAALRVERAGKARKGHVEACAFPASEEQGLVYVHYYITLHGITLPAVGGGQEKEEQQEQQQQ